MVHRIRRCQQLNICYVFACGAQAAAGEERRGGGTAEVQSGVAGAALRRRQTGGRSAVAGGLARPSRAVAM
jgi:hypothetical protein